MADNIHFRCTFDVDPASQASAGFPDLVRELAQWLRRKEPALNASPEWLLTSGTRRKPDGRSSIVVDSLGESDSPGNPEMWALRYEHEDAEFSARRWHVDFGIVRTESRKWRLATTVGNKLRDRFIGKEPGHLPVTPPRVIRDLASSVNWRCLAGSMQLVGTPIPVQLGKADRLVRAIEDKHRGCPLVYVSRSRTSNEALLDPVRLAASIVGAGVVYVAESSDIDEELDFLVVPREFRAVNGTVRVFAPGVDFRNPRQAYRHRYFTRFQIEELTPAEVEGQIARALTRRQGWASVRSSIESVDDVETKRRELRRISLQSNLDMASRDELLRLYEEDNVRLEAEKATLSKDKEGAELLIEEGEAQLQETRDSLRKAEYEADTARTESADAKKQLTAVRLAVDTARNIRKLPSTLNEVVELIERLHKDTIVFTDEARESAEEATFDDPAIAWECLHVTATILPKLAFEMEGVALAQEFRNRTGFELSLTEGRQTKKDAKLVDMRKVNYDGRDWDIVAHVKHGNKPPKCLRVYFALDRGSKRIIVGHCGDHLETAGTRRRR